MGQDKVVGVGMKVMEAARQVEATGVMSQAEVVVVVVKTSRAVEQQAQETYDQMVTWRCLVSVTVESHKQVQMAIQLNNDED